MFKYDYRFTPHINPGIIELKLYKYHMDLLWSYIKKSTVNDGWEIDKDNNVIKRGPYQQWSLYDTTKLFENEVVIPAVNAYVERWGFPMTCKSTHYPIPRLNRFWTRISKAGEYQPMHFHQSIWSFIIWMKIPFEYEDEQTEELTELYPESGNMTICYLDSIGRLAKQPFRLGKNYEGTMLLFPGDFNHIVYPFHTTDEYRISVAGDISVDSMQSLDPLPVNSTSDFAYKNFYDTVNEELK